MKKYLVGCALLLVLALAGCGGPKAVSGGLIYSPYPIDTSIVIIDEPDEEAPIETLRFCHDTDNGIIRWEAGSIYGYYNNASRFEFFDYCRRSDELVEFSCEDREPVNTSFTCEHGCENNHCL